MQGIIFSQIEENYYNHLFNSFKSQNDFITPQEVFNLFMKSGLDKSKLKEIWDLSNVRKAPNLNKVEFFAACRYLALSQNNQTKNLNLFNNNTKFFPKFDGISFNFPVQNEEKNKNVFDEDFEEFTDYSKVNSHSNIITNENNKNSSKNTHDILDFSKNLQDSKLIVNDNLNLNNDSNNLKKQENNDPHNIMIDKKNQIKVEEIKMLDSMIKELKTRNLTLNELDNINNKNELNNQFDINNSIISQNNYPPINKQDIKQDQAPKDLDSLLKMFDSLNVEEPKQLPLNTTNSNLISDNLIPINNQYNNSMDNKLNTNIPIQNKNVKIDEDEFEDFEEHTTEVNQVSTNNMDNSSNFPNSFVINNEVIKQLPQQYIPPPKEDKKPKLENFNMNSLLNDFSSLKKNINEEKTNQFNENKNEPVSVIQNSNVEAFPRKDIMDLLDNINFNNDFNNKEDSAHHNIPNEVNSIIVPTEQVENTVTSIPCNTDNKKSDKEIITDDLEFFEFEDASENKTTENASEQIVNPINLNVYEEGTFTKELEQYKKDEIINKTKEEKHNILNYTPNDFLREFMNESKKKDSNDYEFVEDTIKAEKTEETQSEVKNLNMNNSFETLINQILKEKKVRSLFYNNSIKLLEKIINELIEVNKYLEELTKMNLTAEEEEGLKQNKKFSNFIEGSMVLISLYLTIKNTIKNIIELEEFKNEGIEFSHKIFDKSHHLITDLNNHSRRFIYEERIKELSESCFKVNYTINLSNQYCNLCFTELKDFPNTNIFLHDFHIHCINFWINNVDQRSPYQL